MAIVSGLVLLFATQVAAPPSEEAKRALVESIESRSAVYWEAARKIWRWAEPGYQESKSSGLLADLLRKAGFSVTTGDAGIPTAIVASYGSGSPIVGILGEFDALPELSQEPVSHRSPVADQDYGHACGHHLFGVGSAAAAIAVAEQIKAGHLRGTIRFYGTPAEEGGSAKTFMARAGLFDNADVILHWHPSDKNSAGDPRNLARIAVKFRFRGRSAHAASAPELGRSALDAVEITNYAAQHLREHTPDFTRIHHVITAGGGAPNVVPNFAEVFYYVRHPEAPVVQDLYRRLELCARAGALATETQLEVEYLGGTYNMLPNDRLTEVILTNLRALNDLRYSDEEITYAQELQTTLSRQNPLESIREVVDQRGKVQKGSTDVGDVSWVVPTSGFTTATWVPGTPAHSWQAVSAGGMSIGRNGMLLAAKTLAATAWDLFLDPEAIAAAKAEHRKRLEEHRYRPMLREGQTPPLDYRAPARAEKTR